ncbi:hypothetical protein A5886_000405 [Enterococcus sp. 8G7_MSG3316]|uniref:Amino acid permease n=1 Tax=Candidatus Enterococcus testudinis TaxID=1834191 RepID=A0A242A2S2_9ENTE|nr:amino acid permease [Enterococcus sp. 8G7_MSG3316]OTN75335.1 hypothetical protein A5886_000405 [Enterococcus sp. 8G7_MSG3316]
MTSIKKTLSLPMLVLIITTTIYSFSSMLTAFFMMGTKSLPWFLISALFYFIPYALIVAQYSKKYANQSGTIYDWLKDSLSPRAAFITAFLWYCSYFTWMVSLFMKLLIPLSILLFGQDLTASITWFGLSEGFWLAIFSIIGVLLLTWIITSGFQTILSFLKISSVTMIGLIILSICGNVLLILKQPALFLFHLRQSAGAPSFFEGTTDQFWTQLPFFIFSITAFGGLDTVASLVDRTKNSRKQFPKGILLSGGLIVGLYFLGIVLWSGANDLQFLRTTDQMHLGNLMYGLMGALAQQLGTAFDLSPAYQELLVQIFLRYTAFTLLTAYIGLLSSITYGPLKSLIKGTPQGLWSTKILQLNKHHMPVFAIWLQSTAIMCCILFLSFNTPFVGDLFNQLTYMTNVSRAIPYFIVAISFPFFLQKQIVAKEDLFLRNNHVNRLLAFSVCLSIFIAIGFQIYEPFKLGNYLNTLTLVLGPILFGLFAKFVYQRFERKQSI